jgi:hypothetical protein
MTVHVEVTAADITEGRRKDCKSCPIALALNRAAPQFAPWYVTNNWAMGEPEVCWKIDLPAPARDFICDYDQRAGVAPFSFTLELPKEYVECVSPTS